MTDASAPSALSKLKIDRGARKPVQKKTNWLPWALAIGVVACAVGYFVIMPQTTEVRSTSVVFTAPSQQYVQLTASGYVVAQRRAAVASKASGRLVELNVREGSHVKTGDLLARLDSSDINAAILGAHAVVHQAEANFKQAQVQLINARAGNRPHPQFGGAGFCVASNGGNHGQQKQSRFCSSSSSRSGVGSSRSPTQSAAR